MACIIINDTARTINYQTNSMVGSGYLAPGLNASFTPVASTECFVNPDAGYQLNVQSNTQYNLVGIKFRYSVSQSIAAE